MSEADLRPAYRVIKLAPGFDLGAFDCGEPSYNEWLIRHAAASVSAGVCAVYLLLETTDDRARVVGYYAINPTQVVRDDLPRSLARGGPQTVPAWKLGKLAVHVDLRADPDAQWGRHLLRDALETVVRVADAGGGNAGRILRSCPGMLTAEVHDYHDIETPALAAVLARRAQPDHLSLGFPDPRR